MCTFCRRHCLGGILEQYWSGLVAALWCRAVSSLFQDADEILGHSGRRYECCQILRQTPQLPSIVGIGNVQRARKSLLDKVIPQIHEEASMDPNHLDLKPNQSIMNCRAGNQKYCY